MLAAVGWALTSVAVPRAELELLMTDDGRWATRFVHVDQTGPHTETHIVSFAAPMFSPSRERLPSARDLPKSLDGAVGALRVKKVVPAHHVAMDVGHGRCAVDVVAVLLQKFADRGRHLGAEHDVVGGHGGGVVPPVGVLRGPPVAGRGRKKWGDVQVCG